MSTTRRSKPLPSGRHGNGSASVACSARARSSASKTSSTSASSPYGEAVEAGGDDALAKLCRHAGVDATPAALAAMRDPDGWTYAGFGPGAAPYGLEADGADNATGGYRCAQSALRQLSP